MTEYYVFRFLPILLAETIVLWRMKWASLPVSALDALLMNFASFLGLMLGLGPYITSNGPWGLTLFCTYSILVEGVVLLALERHPARKVWLTSAAANLVSTAIIAAEVIFSGGLRVLPDNHASGPASWLEAVGYLASLLFWLQALV